MRARGFSLLEVMVAVAILGLTLTVILSAQGNISAKNQQATNMAFAGSLARCKMTEVEEKLLKMGYPEIDQIDTAVSCCEDFDREGFTCDTRVEKIELPQLENTSGDGGSLFGAPASSSNPLSGVLNNPAGTGQLNLSMEAGAEGIQQLAGQMGGAEGMMSTVMGIVYPSLKPMMEASVRRVSVTVHWKEGPNIRELPIIQYVTNPQRGGLLAGFPLGDAGMSSSTAGGGASGAPASTGTTRSRGGL